jgi:DNA topoisomerase-1
MQAERITDPIESAQIAGLRYVTDDIPGIQRQRCGKGFTYLDAKGKRISDPQERHRIEALGIPPAYTHVWICPDANGHLQATGRDAKGRKQYRYHPRWRQVRDETKFSRMIAFGEALPLIRQRTEKDLGLPGLPREKVLATVVRLLETTLIRVGNQEYAKENRSFGLTTMRDRHVEISGTKIKFQFRGKSGKQHSIDVRDRRLAQIVKRCRDIPGYELFQYLDENGQRQTIDSGDVNTYLQEITGEEFTAKDFRTWAATVLAIVTLQECEACNSEAQAKHNITQMIKTVSQQLGNTPTVCRKYYVHPAVVDIYLKGTLLDILTQQTKQQRTDLFEGLRSEEAAVMKLLQHHLQQA